MNGAVTLDDVRHAATDPAASRRVHAALTERRKSNPKFSVRDLERELSAGCVATPRPSTGTHNRIAATPNRTAATTDRTEAARLAAFTARWAKSPAVVDALMLDMISGAEPKGGVSLQGMVSVLTRESSARGAICADVDRFTKLCTEGDDGNARAYAMRISGALGGDPSQFSEARPKRAANVPEQEKPKAETTSVDATVPGGWAKPARRPKAEPEPPEEAA